MTPDTTAPNSNHSRIPFNERNPDRSSTPYRPPASLLTAIGFVVSITWISQIANEVVACLQTIGSALSISDAVLGVTVFAVGNSLGDLVADVTVAKLGFPVMALSACFGGPMLNILFGIGGAGMYTVLARGLKNGLGGGVSVLPAFPFAISSTLLLSAGFLLLTLVGILIAVPLRGWKMDRLVGISLISIWTVGIVVNLAVEIISSKGRASGGA